MDEVTGTMIASKTNSNQIARTWPSFVPEKAPWKGSSNWRKMIIVLGSFFAYSQRVRNDEYTKKATLAHGYLFDFVKKIVFCGMVFNWFMSIQQKVIAAGH